MPYEKTLKTPYGGYYHSEIPEEDAELTHVGPGTPGGEYLRRFWQPIAFASELSDLPVPIRILGEDLVLYRDGTGTIGLLEKHCSHRGASLEYAMVEEQGIRCCYHSWLYDADGTILEMPGEPATSTFKDRFFHGAYPVREYSGLIFAYMGPPAAIPAFPDYDVFQNPALEAIPGDNYVMPCNWLQIMDNIMDPAHLVFLHTQVSGAQFTDAYGVMSQTEWYETPVGMAYVDTRRIDDKVWVHIADAILPNMNQFPPLDEDAKTEKLHEPPVKTNWCVPIDDTHTLRIGVIHTRPDVKKDWKAIAGDTETLSKRPYEERQRTPGDYEAQTGQREIAVHALEHLATTDRGLIMFRKLLREGIQGVAKGNDPKGLVTGADVSDPIQTYTQDTVITVAEAATAEEDRELLMEVGRLVLRGEYEELEESYGVNVTALL